MKCPRCDSEIDFAEQVKDAQEKYWCDAEYGPIILMITCYSEECIEQNPIMMMELYPMEDEDFEEVETDDGKKIIIPKQPQEQRLTDENNDGTTEIK